MKGKMIVFYGINNLGKSTQADLLIDYFNKKGLKAEYLKYPVYDMEPTGPFINTVLRSGKKQEITEQELQMWYTLNRFQYEQILKKKLEQGINVITEDYSGTGIVWGTAKGADFDWLVEMNKYLMKEDLSILFDGERFLEGKEHNHIHESDDELMNKCREVHEKLGEKFKWIRINANQSKEAVFEDIKKIIEEKLDL